MQIESVKNLKRSNNIPDDKPGMYYWFAKEDTVDFILKRLGVPENEFDLLKNKMLKENDLFCIYVGLAAKESILHRFNWHTTCKSVDTSIKYGTCTTLRISIGSLLKDVYSQEKIDAFMDALYYSYVPYDLTIRSKEAIERISQDEYGLINSHVNILNIQENHVPCIQKYKKNLKALRKKYLKEARDIVEKKAKNA